MERTMPVEMFAPGETIREELEARRWTQSDLAEILGRSLVSINEILTGKRAITPETARGLGDVFGVDPQFFLNLESAYQLWRVKKSNAHGEEVSRRAALYEKVPVRELVRRRWIERSKNIEVFEKRIHAFYGVKNFDEQPRFWRVAAKTSTTNFNWAHWAWLARAKQIAPAVSAARFRDSSIAEVIDRLRPLLHTPEEARHVPKILADAGIRLVIIEHLARTKIDGACLWLDAKSPVIVLSLRYDRIDHFWHTLFHELGHLQNKHGLREIEPFDVDMFGEAAPPMETRSEAEQLADSFASNTLISRVELEDFIARVQPLYSKDKIRGFASRLGVHPGIVVGQLQHRGDIDWRHSRDMLVAVRRFIMGVAITEGWGNTVPIPSV